MGDIACEVAPANGRHPVGIQLVREKMKLLQVLPESPLVDLGILRGPVIFVSQPPEQNAGMVIVLADHVAQGTPAHLSEGFVADSSAAPRNLLPYEDPQAVAVLEDSARLLIVCEANEAHAHILDELHLLIEQLVGHSRRVPRVIFVPMRSTDEQPS